jgi:hypothetical protein
MISLLLLGGCGSISNAWILEDAEFLDALPAEERQTVAIDAESGAAKGETDPPYLLVSSYGVAAQVNAAIFQVLDAVDAIRAIRPTERTDDTRTWGPFPWRDGVDIRAQMTRSGTGRYDWSVDAIDGTDEARLLEGVHFAGETVAQGDGQFTWTLDDTEAMLGEPARGTLVVDYDNRAGVDLLVDIDGWTDGSADPLDARYAYLDDGDQGDFQYATQADLGSDGGDPETVQVRTRWLADKSGRADAVITGGALGSLTAEWSQCWDSTLSLTYQDDTFHWFDASGTEDACVFDTFATVDRL